MTALKVDTRITLQESLHPGFAAEIVATPGGENLMRCIQCGTCSGACPLATCMEHTPRQIIAMTRAGFEDRVLSSSTIWLCASCYACTVECPKQIRVTDIMYALKQRALSKRVYPRRFPTPVLAEEFFESVRRTGRSNEARTAARMLARTNPLKILGNAALGLKLMKRGRMSFRTETMSGDIGPLRTMLEHVEHGSGARAS